MTIDRPLGISQAIQVVADVGHQLAGVCVTLRAAASSMASGSPSSRRHSSRTASTSPVVDGRWAPAAPARSTKSSAAARTPSSVPVGSGRTTWTCSPSTPSRRRLVARIVTCVVRASRRAHQRRRRLGHVLAVVEHQQHAPRVQEVDEALQEARAGRDLEPQRRRHRAVERGGIDDRRQLAQVDAVGEPRRGASRPGGGPAGSCRRRRGRSVSAGGRRRASRRARPVLSCRPTKELPGTPSTAGPVDPSPRE